MKNTSVNINRLALLILILFIVSSGVTLTSRVLQIFYSNPEVINLMAVQVKLITFVYAMFGLTINIGSAVWLYLKTKRIDNYCWVWTLLGLFAGVFGVILWFLNQIYNEIINNNNA